MLVTLVPHALESGGATSDTMGTVAIPLYDFTSWEPCQSFFSGCTVRARWSRYLNRHSTTALSIFARIFFRPCTVERDVAPAVTP